VRREGACFDVLLREIVHKGDCIATLPWEVIAFLGDRSGFWGAACWWRWLVSTAWAAILRFLLRLLLSLFFWQMLVDDFLYGVVQFAVGGQDAALADR
jgi:hypothetical protein